jgi:hypothetical protein
MQPAGTSALQFMKVLKLHRAWNQRAAHMLDGTVLAEPSGFYNTGVLARRFNPCRLCHRRGATAVAVALLVRSKNRACPLIICLVCDALHTFGSTRTAYHASWPRGFLPYRLCNRPATMNTQALLSACTSHGAWRHGACQIRCDLWRIRWLWPYCHSFVVYVCLASCFTSVFSYE